MQVDRSTSARWVLHFGLMLNDLIRREMRHPNRWWRGDDTYIRVAGRWTHLYRAIASAGNTIDFLLWPNRDLAAAKGFLQLALSGTTVGPRVINVDGHPAYATAIAELKESGDLGRNCRCRPSPYMHNIIEIVFTQMTKPNLLAGRMRGDYVTNLDFALGHKGPVNQQFHRRAFLIRRCIGKTGVDSAAEILDSMSPTEPTPPAD